MLSLFSMKIARPCLKWVVFALESGGPLMVPVMEPGDSDITQLYRQTFLFGGGVFLCKTTHSFPGTQLTKDLPLLSGTL